MKLFSIEGPGSEKPKNKVCWALIKTLKSDDNASFRKAIVTSMFHVNRSIPKVVDRGALR